MRKPLTHEQKAHRAEYLKAWRASHPDRARAAEHRYRERHPERIQEVNRRGRERLGPDYWRQWNRMRKATILERYGGRCACCGETELVFLSFDHIDGGGHRERLNIGQSGVIKKLLASLDPLPDYRILCMNCQFGTMRGAICPHQLTG